MAMSLDERIANLRTNYLTEGSDDATCKLPWRTVIELLDELDSLRLMAVLHTGSPGARTLPLPPHISMDEDGLLWVSPGDDIPPDWEFKITDAGGEWELNNVWAPGAIHSEERVMVRPGPDSTGYLYLRDTVLLQT